MTKQQRGRNKQIDGMFYFVLGGISMILSIITFVKNFKALTYTLFTAGLVLIQSGSNYITWAKIDKLDEDE